MIKETIDVIDALISTELNLIGLVERVYKFTDPQQIYPAKYLGGGQYRNVDLVNCSYHRLNGAQSSSESESREGCGDALLLGDKLGDPDNLFRGEFSLFLGRVLALDELCEMGPNLMEIGHVSFDVAFGLDGLSGAIDLFQFSLRAPKFFLNRTEIGLQELLDLGV